jgi:hypothetical protein
MAKVIYVFGSNLKGIHGSGTAREALLHWGAIFGQGKGLQGRSYALPTKETPYRSLSLAGIESEVLDFIDCAKANPDLTFYVTQVGCGLAGYTPNVIGPMFREATKLSNVDLPDEFIKEIEKNNAIRSHSS